MPHRLVLLRHAKAEPAGGLDDELRPLALEGRRQASAVGAGLRAAGLEPEVVLVSSAVRTRQTWDRVRAGLGAVPGDVQVSEAVYHAGVRSLLELVRGVDAAAETVLIVGHEPAVSQVAAVLAGPGSDPGLQAAVRAGVPTATYSVLETDTAWADLAPDGARLVAVVRPE